MLSNGEVVLRPQQLADVLACVISKRPETLGRIGDAKEGLLRHDEESLSAIWGDYDRRLWCSDNGAEPIFITLLHKSGLAYHLYGPDGKPLGVSLVMAMLPEKPEGYDPLAAVNNAGLMKLLLKGNVTQRACLTIKYAHLPSTLLCRAQERLKRYAMMGAAWKHGFAIVIDKCEGNDHDSYCIVYERDDGIVLLAAGRDYTARSVVLVELIALIAEKYPTVEMTDIIVEHEECKGRYWDKADIESSLLRPGYVEWNNVRIPLGGLEMLFSVHQMSDRGDSGHGDHCNVSVSLMSLIEKSDPKEKKREDRLAVPLPDELTRLESLLARAESSVTDDVDVTISMQLQQCIPELLILYGVKRSKNALKTLWVILQHTGKDDKRSIVAYPVSPGTRVGQWQVVDLGKVEISDSDDQEDGVNALLNHENDILERRVTQLLGRSLDCLSVQLPPSWSIAMIRDIHEYEVPQHCTTACAR